MSKHGEKLPDVVGPAESAELPAELAELAALASAADARNAAQDQPPAAAGQDVALAPDQGAEISAMLQACMAMVEPVAPYLPRAYTPEVCERIGIAVSAVAQKRGWDLTQLASPEAMLLFVTVPPSITAWNMAKDYYAWKARQDALQSGGNAAPVKPEESGVMAHGG